MIDFYFFSVYFVNVLGYHLSGRNKKHMVSPITNSQASWGRDKLYNSSERLCLDWLLALDGTVSWVSIYKTEFFGDSIWTNVRSNNKKSNFFFLSNRGLDEFSSSTLVHQYITAYPKVAMSFSLDLMGTLMKKFFPRTCISSFFLNAYE